MSFIALIDYEMGNLLSVSKALEHVGAQVRTVRTPEEASGADGLLLPGVGNFGDGMAHLEKSGFRLLVSNWIREDRPFMGICLGMQMLLEGSEEAPGVKGLGIFKGSVLRFPAGSAKIPHMGWNTIVPDPANHFIGDISSDAWFYFVHSYYAKPEDPSVVAARTDYILDFASVLSRGHLIATQFHPEKSQENGLAIIRNFVNAANNWRKRQ